MKNYKQFLEDFTLLISAKSVQSDALNKMPFGKGVADAYKVFTDVCKRMGFFVTDYDGYIGEFSVGGDESEQSYQNALGIIGHLDVVPAEGDWNTDPYVLTLKDGVFYGRGVEDDKGPMLCCLYAIKELLDEGHTFNRKVRFIIGLNEESGWADVDYYKTKAVLPTEGFSPDGNFPVTYAEKGPAKVVFKYAYDGNFYDFSGGTVSNAVPDYAFAKGKVDKSLAKKYGLKIDGDKIESFGKSAHGSRPQDGINAVKALLEYVNEVDGGKVSPLIENLFNDKQGVAKLGNETGYATISPNLISFFDGAIVITCDLRVPAKMDINDFIPLLDNTGIEYKIESYHKPHYVDVNGTLVQRLNKAYNDATGENDVPYSCSGATFASVFKSGVAFGPAFKNVKSAIHEPNEFMSEENLLKMFNIYKKAIYETCCR